MNPTQFSQQLRKGTSASRARRRKVSSLSVMAVGSMTYISLFQAGVITHLVEPPLPRFDADTVDASAEASKPFSISDAALGRGSYAATLALAAMGGEDRAPARPRIPLALAAKVGFDTLQAVRLSVSQWAEHRAFCCWCLLATAATFASVPLVLPEAHAALKQVTATRG